MYISIDEIAIVVWCNGDWCFLDELEEIGQNKSDDFKILVAPIGEEIQEVQFFLESINYD